jgi:putative glutamine amidotransferase
VDVVKDSLLWNITNSDTGEVNSAHHQSADVASKELEVIANAVSITEAMQWKEPEDKSWLLLVQWHPERMFDKQSVFAHNIKTAFIKKCYE